MVKDWMLSSQNSIAELYPLCVRRASEYLTLYSFQKGLNLISSHMLKNSWIYLHCFPFTVRKREGPDLSRRLVQYAADLPFDPKCDQLQTFWLCIKSKEAGRSRFGLQEVTATRRGKRYKLLSESWYWLNPFTIYIFTSTSSLSTQ